MNSFNREGKLEGIYYISPKKDFNKYLLGRSEVNHFVFSEGFVSREHCVFLVSKNKVFYRDLDSKFGVFKRMPLKMNLH